MSNPTYDHGLDVKNIFITLKILILFFCVIPVTQAIFMASSSDDILDFNIAKMVTFLIIISLVTLTVNLTAAVVAAFLSPARIVPILFGLLSTAAIAYALFFLASLSVVLLEWKRIRASAFQKILSVFTTPLFIATYIPISAQALVSRVEWKPIDHSVQISIDELNKKKNPKG